MFTVSQSHDEFVDFYADSRIDFERKMEEKDLIHPPDADRHWMRFNHLLLPILRQFDHRRGARIGVEDYGVDRKVSSDMLFSAKNEKPRFGDKWYGVDFEIPEKKKKVKAAKNAMSIINEVMQREGMRAKEMYKVEESVNGQVVVSFHYEGKVVAIGMGPNGFAARKQCAMNVISRFKSEDEYRPRFATMILTKELGLTVSKNKGKMKKQKPSLSLQYGAVPVALNGRHRRNDHRYEYVDVDGNRKTVHHDDARKEEDIAVDLMYLSRWNEFDSRGHEIPTHCHGLLDVDGRKVAEIEVKTQIMDKPEKSKIEENVKPEITERVKAEIEVKVEADSIAISMPLPHSKRQMMSVDL